MLPHPGGTGSCWQLWPAGQSPPQKLSCPPQWSGPRHAQCPFPSSPHVWLSGQSPPQNDAGFPPQFGMPSVVVVGHGSLVLVVVVVTVQQKPTASGVRVTSAGRHASRIFTVVLKVPSRPRWAHSTAAWAAAVNKRIAVTARARRRGAAIRRTSYAPGASCQSRGALCHPPRKAAVVNAVAKQRQSRGRIMRIAAATLLTIASTAAFFVLERTELAGAGPVALPGRHHAAEGP